jgi:type I site-specific restriction endonuclease
MGSMESDYYICYTATFFIMPLSEAQTRKEIIDIRLAKAGWNVNDLSQVSEELDIIADLKKAEDPLEKYAGHLYSDYALLVKFLSFSCVVIRIVLPEVRSNL